MSLERLKRQLGKELTANPKKSAALGLCLLVAAYFWIPLLLGESSAGGVEQTPIKTLTETMTTVTQTTGRPSADTTSEITWQQIDQWIRTDPTMSPSADAAPARDPFESTQLVKDDTATEPAERTPATKANREDESRLVLTSTFTGGGRPTALIGGRTYRIGQRVDHIGQEPHLSSEPGLVVAEIHSRYVVLVRSGRNVELHLNDNSVEGVFVLRPSDEGR